MATLFDVLFWIAIAPFILVMAQVIISIPIGIRDAFTYTVLELKRRKNRKKREDFFRRNQNGRK